MKISFFQEYSLNFGLSWNRWTSRSSSQRNCFLKTKHTRMIMQCFYELWILSAKPSHTHFFPLKNYEFPFQRYTTIAAHPFLPFEKLGIHSEDTLQLAPTDFYLWKNYDRIPSMHYNCIPPIRSLCSKTTNPFQRYTTIAAILWPLIFTQKYSNINDRSKLWKKTQMHFSIHEEFKSKLAINSYEIQLVLRWTCSTPIYF